LGIIGERSCNTNVYAATAVVPRFMSEKNQNLVDRKRKKKKKESAHRGEVVS